MVYIVHRYNDLYRSIEKFFPHFFENQSALGLALLTDIRQKGGMFYELARMKFYEASTGYHHELRGFQIIYLGAIPEEPVGSDKCERTNSRDKTYLYVFLQSARLKQLTKKGAKNL